MSYISNIQKRLNFQQSPLPLYAGAFFLSGAHGGMFTLALPFIILIIGGSDKTLGLCSGLGTIAYVISCLTVAKHLDKYNPKHALQLSSSSIMVSVAAVFIVVQLFVHDRLPVSPIIAVIVINIFLSLALALFWPPIMGWLSVGHEGGALTRRLSIFNLSWSLALSISPFIAGFIIQTDPNLAVLAAAVLLAIVFVCVSAAALPVADSASEKQEQAHKKLSPSEPINPDNAVFRLMARMALVTSCIAIVLLRTQFALFFTENLGFSKSQFGIVTTVLCFSSFAGFYITGKTHRWHHSFTPFIFAQIVIALAMILILLSGALWVLYAAAICVGAGQSFIYASHQYYGVSGRKSRSGSMAVHETLLAVGYGAGAIIGGYLAECFDRYAPYKFCLGAVFVALVAQILIFCLYKKRSGRRVP